MDGIGERRWSHDGNLHRQCVCPQYRDGLSSVFGHSPYFRNCFEKRAVFAGRSLGRSLCGHGIFARIGISGGDAGKIVCWYFAEPDCLWRRTKITAADRTVVWNLLWDGGECVGSGASGRKRHSHGKRNFLYQCGCHGASAFCCCGLFCSDTGLSGCCTAQRERRGGFRAALHGWENSRIGSSSG